MMFQLTSSYFLIPCATIKGFLLNGVMQDLIFSLCRMQLDNARHSVLNCFIVYVDELKSRLPSSRAGCHIGAKPTKNFNHVDDMNILAPSARPLNKLQQTCLTQIKLKSFRYLNIDTTWRLFLTST